MSNKTYYYVSYHFEEFHPKKIGSRILDISGFGGHVLEEVHPIDWVTIINTRNNTSVTTILSWQQIPEDVALRYLENKEETNEQ